MKTIIVLFCICILLSCDKREDILSTSPENPERAELTIDEMKCLIQPQVIPYEKALKEVNEFIDLLKTETRSNVKRKIAEVKIFCNINMRSNNPEDISLLDTAMYLFNFSDNQGYALVSADSRSEGILAFVESGTLGDTITNPGLAVFLSRIKIYQQTKIEEDKALKDSLYKQTLEKIENYSQSTRVRPGDGTRPPIDRPYTNPWITKAKKEPLLSTQWGQWSPYNSRVPSGCPTGCVATATAQIMAYYRYPINYNNYIYHWSNMLTTPPDITGKNDIGELFYRIGEMVEMEYKPQGSGAFSNKVPGCLERMGYKNPGHHQGYNNNIITNSLNNSSPCYVSGNAIKEDNGWWFIHISNYKEGHAWILDGYIQQIRGVSFSQNRPGEIPLVTTEERILLHCNYGWNGVSDGYYNSAVFNTNVGPIETRGESGFYQYNLMIIPDIKP